MGQVIIYIVVKIVSKAVIFKVMNKETRLLFTEFVDINHPKLTEERGRGCIIARKGDESGNFLL